MAKKTEEPVADSQVEVVEAAPLPIEENFGRDDLNKLAATVNFLLSRLK